MSLKPCLVIDIDDTLYVHNSKLLQYHKIKPDNHLKAQFQRIQHPKFILTNATYGHANIILNKMDVEDEFIKIYSRDSIPRMKPSFDCYQSVQTDICNELHCSQNQYIFFDDLLENLEGAHHMNWNTIWISPNYTQASKYPYVDHAFPSLREALDKLSL